MGYLLIYNFYSVLLGVLSGKYANSKNRSGIIWGVLTWGVLILSPPAFLHLPIYPYNSLYFTLRNPVLTSFLLSPWAYLFMMFLIYIVPKKTYR
jgi:hypothetical protein